MDSVESSAPHTLLRFDAASTLSLKEAAALGGCDRETVLRWSLKAGIARQPGGVGGRWRIHRAGWAILLAGERDTLRDLRAGKLTAAVRNALDTAGTTHQSTTRTQAAASCVAEVAA